MQDYQKALRRLKQNFRYYKGMQAVRVRAMTLMRVLAGIDRGMSVERAAELQGVRRQYFYFWLRRLQASDYDLRCLAGKSKRPHNSPRATPKAVIALAKKIRAIDESGANA